MLSGPNRAPNATCCAGVGGLVARKKITLVLDERLGGSAPRSSRPTGPGMGEIDAGDLRAQRAGGAATDAQGLTHVGRSGVVERPWYNSCSGGRDMDKPTNRFDADERAAEIRDQGYTVIRDFMDTAALAALPRALAPYLGALTAAATTSRVLKPSGSTPWWRAPGFRGSGDRRAADGAAQSFPGRELPALGDPRHRNLDAWRDGAGDPYRRRILPSAQVEPARSATPGDRRHRRVHPGRPARPEVIPGSHLRSGDEDRLLARGRNRAAGNAAGPDGRCQPALCFVFPGKLLHRGGGANTTDKPRLAFTNQYCAGWAAAGETSSCPSRRRSCGACRPAPRRCWATNSGRASWAW